MTEEESWHPCPICFEEMQNLSKLEQQQKASNLTIRKQHKSGEASAILGILCGHFFHWKCLQNW